MEKMTIKQYAIACGISVPAAHKRLLDTTNYPEIKGIEKVTDKFFLLKINRSKGFTKNTKIS